LRVVLGVAVSAGLFAFLLMSVDLRELGRQLARTDWSWVVAAMVIGLAGVYARAFRWRWLFPPGVEPTGIAAATMIGYMANNVLPCAASPHATMAGRHTPVGVDLRDGAARARRHPHAGPPASHRGLDARRVGAARERGVGDAARRPPRPAIHRGLGGARVRRR